jgi:acid phosphatase
LEDKQVGIARRKIEELSDEEKLKLNGYYVRLRYNDKPVTIPGCALPGNHLDGDESFCTLVGSPRSMFISLADTPIRRPSRR